MDTTAFVTSLVTSLLIFVVLTLVYVLLSRRPGNYPVYYPALLLKGSNPEEARLRGRFVWLWEAWHASEKDIVKWAGLDAAVYIHLLDSALKILGYTAVFCIPVLVTICALSDNYKYEKQRQQTTKTGNSNSTFSGFDKLAMGNIREKDRKLWVFVIGAYWVSIVTYLVLWTKYRHISRLRHAELDSNLKPERLAVLVRDIPVGQRGEAEVDGYFKRIHGESYQECVMAKNLKSAAKVWASLESSKQKLARAEAVYASSGNGKGEGRRPRHRRGMLGLFGGEVDSIDFYKEEIAQLKKQVGEEQKKSYKADKQQSAAIILFNNPTAAAASAQCVYATKANQWVTCPAPEPRQLVWDNLHMRWFQRLLRRALVCLIVALTILFYMIPISFVSAFATLDKLEKLIPFVKHIEKITVLSTLLQAYLPQLALILFLALLPTLLLYLSKMEGLVSRSHIDRAAAGKYFYFNVFNVFLGITITSSLFDTVKDIQKDPGSTVSLLGKAIPPAASFFITFIALKLFVGYGLQLSRLIPLLIFHAKKKYLCKTDADIKAAWAPPDFGYATRVPGDILILTIAISYAVIAPMILPFALVYFGLGWIIARHQALKVVVPSYESEGRMWPHMHNRILAALFVSQLAMLGYFSVKKFYFSPVLLPLPLATPVFGFISNRVFYPGFRVIPLDNNQAKDLPTTAAIANAYIPACLVPDEDRRDKFEDARSAVSSSTTTPPPV